VKRELARLGFSNPDIHPRIKAGNYNRQRIDVARMSADNTDGVVNKSLQLVSIAMYMCAVVPVS
jgi:hypothetical protein